MQELLKATPFIIGAAISPVLLVMTLFILSRPVAPAKKSLLFLLGSTVTITLIGTIIFFTTTVRPDPSPSKDLLPHIIIGLLLLFLAFNILRQGPAKAENKPQKNDSPIKYLTLGAILMVTNFTTIAMVFALALELRSSGILGAEKFMYLAAVIIFSLLPIILPLLVLALAGKRSADILEKLSSFMQRYAHIATAVFFALMGVYVLLKPFL